MSWKRLFEKKILERAYEYSYGGLVLDITRIDNVFNARVMGSDIYNVRIEVDEYLFPVHMSCTCPYAEDGKKCKHIAAVLMSIPYGGLKNTEITTKDELKRVISSLSEEEAKDYLFNLAVDSSDVLRSLGRKYSEYSQSSFLENLKVKYHFLLAGCSDNEGVFSSDYYIISETGKFFDYNLDSLLKYNSRADISSFFLFMLSELSAVEDDSQNMDLEEAEKLIFSHYDKLVKESSAEESSTIFAALSKRVEDGPRVFRKAASLLFLASAFTGRSEMEKTLEIIRNEIEKKGPELYLLKTATDVMKKLEQNNESIISFLDGYLPASAAVIAKADYFMSLGKLDEAISLLGNKEYCDRVEIYLQLCGLLEKNKREDELLEVLFGYAVRHHERTSIEELKARTLKRDCWREYRARLIENTSALTDRLEILAIDRDDDTMMDLIGKEGSIDDIDRYLPIFRKDAALRAIPIIEKYLYKELGEARHYSAYCRIADYIDHTLLVAPEIRNELWAMRERLRKAYPKKRSFVELTEGIW